VTIFQINICCWKNSVQLNTYNNRVCAGTSIVVSFAEPRLVEYAKAMSPDCKYFMAVPISIYAEEDNVIFGAGFKSMDRKDGILGKDVEGWQA